jgi:hypothetical protein
MADPAPHTLYDTLKDFQPALAAGIALIAASIAYLGATAKVRLDRETAERDLANQRLSLYLRLRLEAIVAGTTASDIARLIEANRGFSAVQLLKTYEMTPLCLNTPATEEVWLNLHFLPIDCAKSLQNFKNGVFVLRQIVANDRPPHPSTERDLTHILGSVAEHGVEIARELDCLIAEQGKTNKRV